VPYCFSYGALMKTHASLLTLVLMACSQAQTQRSAPTARFDESDIDSVISSSMARQNVPGLSAAMVIDGALGWSKGYGFSDLENEIPATDDTVYRLASVSKTLTATAAMQLVEQGRLDPDAPVQDYVPSFPEKSWPITSRQLLSHTSGIHHYVTGASESYFHYVNVIDPLALFANDPLLFQPGTEYTYSSNGYNLLGAVVEGASGKPFLAQLKLAVLEPAGMDHVRDDDLYAIIPHRAQGYTTTDNNQLRNSDLVDTSYKVPSGGLCGTAPDLAKFAAAIESGRLITPATFEQMATVQVVGGQPNSDSYGLGWMITADPSGRREVWHTGGQQRVSTILYMLPDQGFAVAILCNQENAGLFNLSRQIASLVLP